MIPAVTRRSIPTQLTPHEVNDARTALLSMRRQAVGFWVLLMPATWGIWQVVTMGVSGLLDAMLLTFAGMLMLIAGRVHHAAKQRPQKRLARRTLARWRRLPLDPRWDAAMILLERIAALSSGDPALQETARRTVTMLFALYEDVERLKRTLPADRVLDGEGEPSERYYRLVAVIRQREAQIESLLGGLRDLHVEINEQLSNFIIEQPGSVHDRLQELMDRMEADREVTRAVGIRGVTVQSML